MLGIKSGNYYLQCRTIKSIRLRPHGLKQKEQYRVIYAYMHYAVYDMIVYSVNPLLVCSYGKWARNFKSRGQRCKFVSLFESYLGNTTHPTILLVDFLFASSNKSIAWRPNG